MDEDLAAAKEEEDGVHDNRRNARLGCVATGHIFRESVHECRCAVGEEDGDHAEHDDCEEGEDGAEVGVPVTICQFLLLR